MDSLPEHNKIFTVRFANEQTAQAVRVSPEANPADILRLLGFTEPNPVLFISGGASKMSDEDKQRTHEMIASVCQFADENDILVLDGGTESGIMKMLGDTRHASGYGFPLVGVSPLGRVSYPGYDNPRQQATLEDNHSHFVLVDGPEWGDESEMIVKLAYAASGKTKPAVGILINGGKIAMQEVYLATTIRKDGMAIIVLEGSGRAADEISTAFRTGKSSQRILKAILSGGDIQLVGTIEGPEAIQGKLASKFLQKM